MSKNPTRERLLVWLVLLLAVPMAVILSCSPALDPTATPAPTETPVPARLQIENVFFSPPQPFNGWVLIIVEGTVPDGCTEIDDIEVSREDDTTFHLTVETTRPEGACTQVVTPFREDVRVDIGDMWAGTYTVIANGETFTFEFDEEFLVPETPDPGS